MLGLAYVIKEMRWTRRGSGSSLCDKNREILPIIRKSLNSLFHGLASYM